MQYVMLLQVKEKSESETVFKAIKLPECKDTDTTYLYKVLSYFALNNWVHLCGVIPCFECGSLTDEEIKFWKSHLVEYKEIIKDQKEIFFLQVKLAKKGIKLYDLNE